MSLSVITANRLADGVAVWFAEGGKWAEKAGEAALFEADGTARRDGSGHGPGPAAGRR